MDGKGVDLHCEPFWTPNIWQQAYLPKHQKLHIKKPPMDLFFWVHAAFPGKQFQSTKQAAVSSCGEASLSLLCCDMLAWGTTPLCSWRGSRHRAYIQTGDTSEGAVNHLLQKNGIEGSSIAHRWTDGWSCADTAASLQFYINHTKWGNVIRKEKSRLLVSELRRQHHTAECTLLRRATPGTGLWDGALRAPGAVSLRWETPSLGLQLLCP